ncbi:ADAMTS-like protein 5 isoform X1 [Hyperolius riggenbachi]|uniref:ADAMTS-like protein 5 isoform X1 n=1 Tax=Hyperolius riggenbachi TaxID=752182 RepID=UPI0035A3ACE9
MWSETWLRMPDPRVIWGLFMIHAVCQYQMIDNRSLQSERQQLSFFGLWTTWSSWTACSSTCGKGVLLRTRKCLRATGENTCVGEPRQYKSCQSKLCPVDAVPFRNMQCSLYNNLPIPGSPEQTYNWVPFYGESAACDLNCIATGYNFYYTFGRALDGTSCGPRFLGTCIKGNCLKTGCDKLLGSKLTTDSCGRCGGKNNSCIFIQKVFRDPYTSTGLFEYKNVTRIPAGALHIKVKDRSRNILALMSKSEGYVINGNWALSYPGVYTVAGTTVRYAHSSSLELLEAPGPTNEDLYILVLFQEQNRGIQYEYRIPRDRHYNIQGDSDGQTTQEPMDVATGTRITTATPSSIRTTVGTEKHKDDHSEVKTDCRKCAPVKGRSQRKKHFCQSDFVIHGKILEKRKIGQETRYDIHVKQVYKKKFPLVHREHIWVSDTCDCPRLQNQQEYIMMLLKQLNKDEFNLNRILLSADSYVRLWSQHEDQQIKLLNRIC